MLAHLKTILYFTFSHVFWNTNFEAVPSKHFEHIQCCQLEVGVKTSSLPIYKKKQIPAFMFDLQGILAGKVKENCLNKLGV